jgi:hypothetical protein
MLKKVLNVPGIKILNKNTQKHLRGGDDNGDFQGEGGYCVDSNDCTATNTVPSVCCSGICVYTYDWRNAC